MLKLVGGSCLFFHEMAVIYEAYVSLVNPQKGHHKACKTDNLVSWTISPVTRQSNRLSF